MTIFRILTPVQISGDDGYDVNWTGVSTHTNEIKMGMWYFWTYTDAGWRFPLYVYPKATIDYAYLYLYLTKIEKDGAWNSFSPTISIADEDDAKPISYGLRGRTTYGSIDWLMSTEPSTYNWYVSPDIKTLIEHITDKSGFVYGNNILLIMKKGDLSDQQLLYYASYDQSSNMAGYINIKYSIPSSIISDDLSPSDSVSFTSPPSDPSSDIIQIDNIQIYTEQLNRNYVDNYRYKSRERSLPQQLELSERMSFVDAKHLQAIAGENVPLWIFGDAYNCIIQKCEFTFHPTFVDTVMSLEVRE